MFVNKSTVEKKKQKMHAALLTYILLYNVSGLLQRTWVDYKQYLVQVILYNYTSSATTSSGFDYPVVLITLYVILRPMWFYNIEHGLNIAGYCLEVIVSLIDRHIRRSHYLGSYSCLLPLLILHLCYSLVFVHR